MYKQNLHTHSVFCDGKDTPERMVQAAIALGFDSIGFSGHGYTPADERYCMTPEKTEQYIQVVGGLKEQYADRICIFCGVEYDMFSQWPLEDFDYAIGAMHYLDIDGTMVEFDSSQENVAKLIEKWFDGDGMAYALQYYKTLAKLPEYGKFDVLGHMDIITRHCENTAFFNEDDPVYRKAALDALDALQGQIPRFEVNTGAIARGRRTTPYPAPFLLDALREREFGAVISADCHDCRMLDKNFDQARRLLWKHGFRKLDILTEQGWQITEL